MNDVPRLARRSHLRGPRGRRNYGFVREDSRRRRDDLEFGLTKGKVIVVTWEREISGEILFSGFHGPNEPGSIRMRFILRSEDLATEERRRNFPDWDDPSDRAKQYNVDNPTQEEDRVAKHRDSERNWVTGPFAHPQDGDREKEDRICDRIQDHLFGDAQSARVGTLTPSPP